MSPTCLICGSPYDKNNCKPLILPCGHTMCQECLAKFVGKSKICIVCNKSWADSSVESLPVCVQLVSGEVMKSVCNLWCNSCRRTTCVKNKENQNDKCDLIHLDEKCLKPAIEYTEMCKKISVKKSNYEKCHEEMTAFCKTLKEEIISLSQLEKQNKQHFIGKDDSDEKILAILNNNIEVCKKSFSTKLPVTRTPLLSPILSALQVNCYFITINFQSLLHRFCLLH